VRAKAAWTVTAGVLLGETDKRFTRAWAYTSGDLESDRKIAEKNEQIIREADNEKELSEAKDTKFMELRDKAFEYAKEVMDPTAVNWVKVEFIWY